MGRNLRRFHSTIEVNVSTIYFRSIDPRRLNRKIGSTPTSSSVYVHQIRVILAPALVSTVSYVAYIIQRGRRYLSQYGTRSLSPRNVHPLYFSHLRQSIIV